MEPLQQSTSTCRLRDQCDCPSKRCEKLGTVFNRVRDPNHPGFEGYLRAFPYQNER